MTITKPNFLTMSVYWFVLSIFMSSIGIPLLVTCIVGAMLGWVSA